MTAVHKKESPRSRFFTFLLLLFQVMGFLLAAFSGENLRVPALLLLIVFPPITLFLLRFCRKQRHLDMDLLRLILLLCSIGMVMLADIADFDDVISQLIFFLPAVGAMFLLITIVRRMTAWEKWARIAGLVSVFAMLLPLAPVIGGNINGAYNWVSLRKLHIPLSFQPSEFVKLAMLLILASGFSKGGTLRNMLPALLFAILMCGILLILQKDLGTLLIYFFLTLAMFYIASGNLPLTLVGLGGGCVGAVGAYGMFNHVRERVATWINPWSDAQNKGYQLVQALIAISSGGWFGRGLGLGTPRMIPYYHTDFIFAAICEEFGLFFALGVLALFALVVIRGMGIAARAKTRFHALLAFGASFILGIQTVVIVGGVTKFIPLTGVTLPFMSAGGSSLLVCMALAGVILGVDSLER